jgi:hypothetical protein
MIGPASQTARLHRAAGQPVKPLLLDPRAAALDQNNQNDDKQHTCNNLDNRGVVHPNPLPFNGFFLAFPVSTGPAPHPAPKAMRFRPADCELPGEARAFSRAPPEHLRIPHYLTRVRRRWIKTIRTMTNSTPATTWIIVVLSISVFSFPH